MRRYAADYVEAGRSVQGGLELKNRGLKQFIILFFGFILSSFTGWLYETVITWIANGMYCDRGILYLPICPIYGFGSCILFLLLHRIKNPLFIFAGGTFITGVFEYVCSYLVELVFHTAFWSYAGWPLSLDDRTSLVGCMVFGLLTVFYMKCLLPLSEWMLQKIGMKKGILVVILLSTMIMIDLLITLRDLPVLI